MRTPCGLPAGKALVECNAAVAKRRNASSASIGYEEIAEETFGRWGRLLISTIIYVELFGTCCLLFILEVRSGKGRAGQISWPLVP